MGTQKVIGGVFGILASIIAWVTVALSIAANSSFRWTTNALSDLGYDGVSSELIFNIGLITAGIFLFIFSIGLLPSLKKLVGKFGCIVISIASIGLIGLAAFNLPHLLHKPFAAIFFIAVPVSLLLIGVGFLRNNQKRIGWATIVSGIITSIFSIITIVFSLMNIPGLAIPESLTVASATVWVFAISILLIRKKI